MDKDYIYIGKENVYDEWLKDGSDKAIARIKQLIKNYLELDNVSFLFGAGSSVHLGAVTIGNIPTAIETAIKKEAEDKKNQLYAEFIKIAQALQGKADPERTADDKKEIKYPLEYFLNYLIALEYVREQDKSACEYVHLKDLIAILKKELFLLCDVHPLEIPEKIIEAKKAEGKDSQIKLLQSNKYIFHEKFLKKILQRPLNLKRANIFTTNYDLAFEYSFDKLGVHYIDGFSGFHHRFFKPETFEYDVYFPGSTTSGKVQRIEKVLKYFKLHGSLSWIKVPPNQHNIYGIQEVPLDFVKGKNNYKDLIIYPSSSKKSHTLDLPYSELFRQFASTITQSQSVLFTLGYSFRDEHINDLIFQALSIPSFTLIIIDLFGNSEIDNLVDMNDPRIIHLKGKKLGDFANFVDDILPDLYDVGNNHKIAETLGKLFPNHVKEEIIDTKNGSRK